MKIKDILTPEPQCVGPEDSLAEAVATMKKVDVGFLPVCNSQRVIGVLTDRDIVIRAVAENLDPKTTRVSEVMSGDIFYCFADQSIEEVAEIMATGRVRRLPVLNRDRHLVGIISLGDLAVRYAGSEIAARVLMRVSKGIMK
ncbi:MAG TPA: CBS domain-containing protein [Candidatus Sulfotelmatobacter sp.]|jgi:CBS domain-containing protein|nr:CBS domain-containing protein [Candidatus Sulfotelmatobacter sp.]